MLRIVIDIQEDDDVYVCKEAVAQALEAMGRVRVVSVTDGEKEL